MAETAEVDKERHLASLWRNALAPFAVAAANVVLLGVTLALASLDSPARLFAMGGFFAQPVLYAIWAALSNTPLVRRAPVAFLANTVAACCFGVVAELRNVVPFVSLLFLVLWCLLAVYRRWKGRVLRCRDNGAAGATSRSKLRVSDYFFLTTVAACFAAVGSWVLGVFPDAVYAEGSSVSDAVLWLLPLYTLVLLPPIAVAVETLKPSRLWLGVAVGVLSLMTFLVLSMAPSIAFAWRPVIAYAGAFFAAAGSALLLRVAGYRVSKDRPPVVTLDPVGSKPSA